MRSTPWSVLNNYVFRITDNDTGVTIHDSAVQQIKLIDYSGGWQTGGRLSGNNFTG